MAPSHCYQKSHKVKEDLKLNIHPLRVSCLRNHLHWLAHPRRRQQEAWSGHPSLLEAMSIQLYTKLFLQKCPVKKWMKRKRNYLPCLTSLKGARSSYSSRHPACLNFTGIHHSPFNESASFVLIPILITALWGSIYALLKDHYWSRPLGMCFLLYRRQKMNTPLTPLLHPVDH